MKRLFLIRGLPGSGKTTLAELISWGANALHTDKDAGKTHECVSFSTDDMFIYGSHSWNKLIESVMTEGTDKQQSTLRYIQETLRPKDNAYHFVPQFISLAHAINLERASKALLQSWYDTVIIHNTISQPWEAENYIIAAKECGYEVFIIECQNDFGSLHYVPQQAIDSMRARWLPLHT